MSVPVLTKKCCIHCGTSFRPSAERTDFCCAGCEFVHGLIKERGLSQYYELQDGGNFPVKPSVFQQRDYTWLVELHRISQGVLDLDLQGLSCIGCVWLVERLFERMPGAQTIAIDPAVGRMRIRSSPDFDILSFAREIQSFGYLIGPASERASRGNRGLLVRLGICAALAMNAMLFTLPSYLGMAPSFEFANLFNRVAFICSTLSFVIGGSYFFGRSWKSLRLGILHIDLPISLGLIAAYAGSTIAWVYGAHSFVYFDFISTFTFLMLAGRWTQEATVRANRNRLLDTNLEVAQPKSGDHYRVNPGEIVPVLSRLLSSGATIGMEWISGESESRTAHEGQLIPSGAVNLTTSVIELEARQSWQESVLSRLLDETPQTDRRARGLERFIRIYLLGVFAVAAISFVVWLAMGFGMMPALQVVTSILVVSCPCAAGVALPLAEQVANARARQVGVLVRDNGLWARLPKVDTIVFDKTGTLTLETMALQESQSLSALAPHERAVLLGMVEHSLHPVATCLREHLLAQGVKPAADLGAIEDVVGAGLEVRFQGAWYRLGKPGWAGTGTGDTLFTCDGSTLAEFHFTDAVREDAAEEFRHLRARGFRLQILSGDRREKVARMSASLGLPNAEARGELSPDDKAACIRELGPQRCLMIGDGANDSLAFNMSLCTGTPAIERGLLERKADFYFLGRGLLGIRRLIDIAGHKQLADRAVLTFAISYNIIAVALSVLGRMTPLLAAILMPLSALVTIGLVLTIMRKK